MSLAEFLDNLGKLPPFEPGGDYDSDTDFFEFYFEDDDAYSEWVNKHLTLYRDYFTNRIVGFSVRNVSELFCK